MRNIEIKITIKYEECGFKESVHVAAVSGEYTFIGTSNGCSIQRVALQAVTVLYRL